VRKISLSILALLALIIQTNYANAQVIVNIPDQEIPQGKAYYIPITGTIQDADLKSISISFEFDAHNIDIKYAIGRENYAIKCDTAKPIFNFDDLEHATATINCSDLRAVENDTICMLLVEGLAGPDTLTTLTINEIKLNGGVLSDAEINDGKIKVPNRIGFKDITRIGYNFPNPFAEQTWFKIQLDYDTKLKFYVYSSLGRLALESGKNEWMKLSRVEGGSHSEITDWDQELDKGKYELKLEIPVDFPSGGYHMIMVTEKDVFEKSFMFLKR
jgi:hypothetical protein